MKICPYCSREFPKEESRCPGCGEEYWLPGEAEDKEKAKPEPLAKGGCLQILLLPFIVALALTLFLVGGGIAINLFIKLESHPIKYAWIVFSLLLGFAVFFWLLSRKRKNANQGERRF